MDYDTAIISDPHANEEGMQAIADKIGNDTKIKRVIFIGDAVDYGAKPNETLDILMGLKPKIVVPGNHDTTVYSHAKGTNEKHNVPKEKVKACVMPTIVEMFTDDPDKFLSGTALKEMALGNPAVWPKGMGNEVERRLIERIDSKRGIIGKATDSYSGKLTRAEIKAFAHSELFTITSEFLSQLPESARVMADFKRKYDAAKKRMDFLERMVKSDQYVIEGNMHLFHSSWHEKEVDRNYVLDENQERVYAEIGVAPRHYTFKEALANAKNVGRRGDTIYVHGHDHVPSIMAAEEGNIRFKLVGVGGAMPRSMNWKGLNYDEKSGSLVEEEVKDSYKQASFVVTNGTDFKILWAPFEYEKTFENMKKMYRWNELDDTQKKKLTFMMPFAMALGEWPGQNAA